MDDRWSSRHERTKSHFRNGKYAPRTNRDRTRPTEDHRTAGRTQYKIVAEETLQIIKSGYYSYNPNTINKQNESSVDVSISLKEAKDATITYTSDQVLQFMSKDVGSFNDNTIFQVEKETTLEGCKRSVDEGYKTLALNFASAKNPGGGFLNGSNAQEESLARASGLYHSIYDSSMYDHNRENNNKCLYSHQMIYSPNIPIFRNNDDQLIEEPYHVSFITSPAVNANEAYKRGVNDKIIYDTMYERIDGILSIARHHKYECVVLGSFGCGVFGNNINDIVFIFSELLTKKYKGIFKKIVFSTLGDYDYKTFLMYF